MVAVAVVAVVVVVVLPIIACSSGSIFIIITIIMTITIEISIQITITRTINYSDVSSITCHPCRLVTSIKDQVIAVSLAPAFTAAICNLSEAAAGRYSASVMYTSGVKRRESRAQLARALAARAMIAKDRYRVTCDI